MKLFYIPHFPDLRIEKNGTIYDASNGLEVVYNGNGALPFGKLEDGTLSQLTVRDIANAYYEEFQNCPVKHIEGDDYSSKNVWYELPKIIFRTSPTTISIWDTEFREVDGFPNYYISEYGVVYGVSTRKILKYHMSKKYLIIALTRDKTFYLYVHRLVYQAYVGDLRKVNDAGEKVVIDHKDEMRWNNHYTNLQEITYAENTMRSRDAIANSFNGNFTTAIRTWGEDLIRFICEQLENGFSTSQISDLLQLTSERDRHAMITLVYRLRKGDNYTEITKDYNFPTIDPNALQIRAKRKYPDALYRAIRYMVLVDKLTSSEIRQILDIDRHFIDNYIHNHCKEGSTTIETVPHEETLEGVTE